MVSLALAYTWMAKALSFISHFFSESVGSDGTGNSMLPPRI
jgi:hypothetical protein